jgi:GntR family transcriptional regulator, carbon starvation induced regulator
MASTSKRGNADDQDIRTLTGATLVSLRRDILSGVLKPGTKIKAEDLRRRYDVGTSPVREALFQLVSEGLVLSEGQRGFRVSEVSDADLVDVTDWRIRLEGEALRRAIEFGDIEWEANAIAALHKLKHLQTDSFETAEAAAHAWEEQHYRFHFALYSACRSPWLLRFARLLIQQGERYRRAFVSYPNIIPSVTEEHERMLELSITRKADEAVALLEEHSRHALEIWREKGGDSLFGVAGS